MKSIITAEEHVALPPHLQEEYDPIEGHSHLLHKQADLESVYIMGLLTGQHHPIFIE